MAPSSIQRRGKSSCNQAPSSNPRITQVSRLRSSICQSSSRHRPQGGKITPSLFTAAIIRTLDWRAFSISAIVACSAQNPRLHRVSMHTPVNRFDSAVTSAAATVAELHSALGVKGRAKDAAEAINSFGSISEAAVAQSPGPRKRVNLRPNTLCPGEAN